MLVPLTPKNECKRKTKCRFDSKRKKFVKFMKEKKTLEFSLVVTNENNVP